MTITSQESLTRGAIQRPKSRCKGSRDAARSRAEAARAGYDPAVPRIAFVASDASPSAWIDVPEGARLVDACDDARAPVELSCRAANCGTCRVEVVEGTALLEPAGPYERELLAREGAGRAHRLACQAVVRGGPGLVRLRWIGAGRSA